MPETIVRPVFKPQIDFAVAPDASIEKAVIVHCQMRVGDPPASGPLPFWCSRKTASERPFCRLGIFPLIRIGNTWEAAVCLPLYSKGWIPPAGCLICWKTFWNRPASWYMVLTRINKSCTTLNCKLPVQNPCTGAIQIC